MRRQYSKSSGFYSEQKSDFLDRNEQLLNKARAQNKFYSQQPKRTKCKICKTPLGHEADFNSHLISYFFCSSCNHLNGEFEDTESFVAEIYTSENGSGYSANYVAEEYSKRLEQIYLPKLDFLIESLTGEEVTILDVGCGSGYFVGAAERRSVKATGIDLNASMVSYGNKQLDLSSNLDKPLKLVSENDFFDEILKTDSSVVSAIGVIEHLREPQEFFQAFDQSSARYLFYSVPLFSLSAIFENVFPSVFPRHLSGAHTHLFTEQSIKSMHDIFGLKTVSEWRFGTDVLDLLRSLTVRIDDLKGSKKVLDYLQNILGAHLDSFQKILDEAHFCSEIHVVAEKITSNNSR